jgi:hypothetical protein
MAKSLCLSFHAFESMLACDIGPDGARTQKSTLFNIKTTLWEDKVLDKDKLYRFPFMIQMPFVQFPPSMKNDHYQCSFLLIAHLNSISDKYSNMVAKTPIEYRPLIETKALKRPIYLSDSNSRKKGTVSSTSSDALESRPLIHLYSLDYVAGDTIRASIDFRDTEAKFSVTISLYQVLEFSMENTSKIEILVDSATLPATSNQNNLICLESSSDLPPSFNFSKMMSLSYKLQIALQKPSSTTSIRNKPLLKKLVTPIWPSTVAQFETEIVFGNLGLGIRSSEALFPYSLFNRSTLPPPKFIEQEEHEDVLPLYDPTKLPHYNEALHGRSLV